MVCPRHQITSTSNPIDLNTIRNILLSLTAVMLTHDPLLVSAQFFPGAREMQIFSRSQQKTLHVCNTHLDIHIVVRKFKRKMNTDTSMLHSRIEQYFGVHVPLSSYTIPKSPKPFKHRLLKAISHEDFRLPDIPPEIE